MHGQAPGLGLGIVALLLVACGSTTPAPGDIESATPSAAIAGSSPSTVSSPASSVAPVAPILPPASTSPGSTAPIPTLSPAEETLRFYVREDVAVACRPRRTDLPPRATAGIECSLQSDLVERVGVYAFDSWEDQVGAYRDRLAAAGVEPRAGDCRHGVPGDANYWGVDELAFEPYSAESEEYGLVVGGLPYLQSRIGCFLDQFGNANVRITCDYGTYIGVLGRTSDIRDLTAWAYHPALSGEPGLCVGPSRDTY